LFLFLWHYGRGRSESAALRKQSRHRQSTPSSGIGRRAVSSAHQHGPARPQVNSVPQREQLRRREAGISNLFVINPTELRGEVVMSGYAEPRHVARPNIRAGSPKGNPMARGSAPMKPIRAGGASLAVLVFSPGLLAELSDCAHAAVRIEQNHSVLTDPARE
jgi:hypothetical protein